MATAAGLLHPRHDMDRHSHSHGHNHHISVTIDNKSAAATSSPRLMAIRMPHTDIQSHNNNDIDGPLEELMRTPRATPVMGGPDFDMDPPYRCPVSTPANFIHPSPRVRRTKPAPVSLEIALDAGTGTPSKRTAGGRPPRPGGATIRASGGQRVHMDYACGGVDGAGGGGGRAGRGSSRGSGTAGLGGVNNQNISTGGGGRVVGNGLPRTNTVLTTPGGSRPKERVGSRTLDYYYVDKAEDEREAAETNTFWLRALCSQPVIEILDKYRRRADFRRSRMLWTKTSSTPGERSLIRAWERNAPHVLGLPPRGSMSLANSSSFVQHGGSRRSVISQHRQFQNEPLERYARGYASQAEEGALQAGGSESGGERGSIVSGAGTAVSFSTAPSSNKSPLQQRAFLSQRSSNPASLRQSPEGEPLQQQQQQQPLANGATKLSNGGAADSHLPTQPLFDLSDHFQVTLPAVPMESRPNRIGTPKARSSQFAHRSLFRDVRKETVAPDFQDTQRESNESRASSTQTAMKARSPGVDNNSAVIQLPAITRV